MKFVPRFASPLQILRTLTTINHWHALRTHALEQLDWNHSRKVRYPTLGGQPIPWFPYSLTFFLEQLISGNLSVLEFGTGESTKWWLAKNCRVVAVEESQEYVSRLNLLATGSANSLIVVDASREDFDIDKQLASIGKQYDIVVIDNSKNRTNAAWSSIPYLRASGWLIWDNSDRDEAVCVIEDLEKIGFQRLDFFDLLPINAYASMATILTRQPIVVNRTQSNGLTMIRTIDY